MSGRLHFLLMFCMVLCGTFRGAAQLPMPDNVFIGAVKHYNVEPNPVPGSIYFWRIDGIPQVGSTMNGIDITWSAAGTYLLEVQEQTPAGCLGPVRSGQIFVSAALRVSDLGVIITVNNPAPIYGNQVVFTIVATNNGPDDATGVAVTDMLPEGYTYISSTATVGSMDPSTGIWTIGALDNGVSGVLAVTATANTAGNYLYTVTISGNEVDVHMINNISSAETDPTDFFIPEGFSPNGDGINDLFVIRGIGQYPANAFVIYNRWGNKVFEANPYQSTWDGTSTRGLRIGGNKLPTGTYFYVLDLGDGSVVFKGTIYLIR